ncbi:uncharacterized protein A1O9_00665 [Exophiala aquamarina CBS 119918]|uniref:Transcription factor domain-containing protein n=1 Tax=Exophiala aquamarina CBS 119918 TaxID=1182545 RepID=A0A072PSF2_9EURO|nr:uncharacterized protein A1O9_00665 [Exophiala aquamarina CBS 119918]KEF62692.1 hypothetical protein A1O9_00665 [Exophiala aquamarina CBS 119918]
MAELRSSIDEQSVDYLGLLTTILTFLFIDLVQGTSKTWRYHLSAGWDFVQQHRASCKWAGSDDAWYVTQSFYLLRIESETSLMWHDGADLLEERVSPSEDAVSLEKLSNYPLFGRTIGASSSILSYLSEINHLSRHMMKSNFEDYDDSTLLNFERMFIFESNAEFLDPEGQESLEDHSQRPSYNEQKAQEMHLRAFEAAAVIYYHQVAEDATPKYLAPYVHAVLHYVFIFLKHCGGNYTLWPVFIAGVEAYEDCDMEKFSDLFENATSMGMRNRKKARQVMEAVWSTRSSITAQTGQNPGEVRVNWTQVMRGLDIDILLV